jgi:hypothetical protein
MRLRNALGGREVAMRKAHVSTGGGIGGLDQWIPWRGIRSLVSANADGRAVHAE